jgi:ElaB/YqjD/DUF883 family membrane-anchored ribosome-binding protein
MAEQVKQPMSLSGLTSLDLRQVNPAEADPEMVEKYRESLDQYKTALEQRYAQPNLFKMSEAFLKPQLGGFSASLGSAMGTLGDTAEQQRAMQIPIAEMQTRITQADILLGQKNKQNEIYQAWRKSGKPMDADTYSRIVSLGAETEIAKAAQKFYEGAEKGLAMSVAATKEMGNDPAQQLQAWTKFQLDPNADQSKIQEKQDAFLKVIEKSKPPQTEQAEWDAMSRYQKMEHASEYAKDQRKLGMNAEDLMRQQANSAPERLALLRSIRDLALGEGIPDSKDSKGNVINGQQQMGAVLNFFGGDNPIEAIARAAADGKLLNGKLEGFDKYAIQVGLSEAAKNKFQVLVKELANNQVAMRNSSLSPTDAFGQLQQLASPNIGNSQNALVTIIDLLGHAEKNSQEKYRYAKEKRLPYGQLEVDPEYNALRGRYADEHVKIATGNPLMTPPSWYDPSYGNVSKKNEPTPPAATNTKPASAPAGSSRPNERTINGQTYVRQADGSYKLKEQ